MTQPSKRNAGYNRRTFIKTTTLAAGTLAFGVPALVRGRDLNSKLNIAAIGAGGKGASDTDCCNTENIVALCDVDSSHCAGQIKRYPEAKFYQDFRRMFEESGDRIDAVHVSTPDHFHAIAASAAMALGKHVYGQKPLTQTIYEARYLRRMAREKGLVTQMGNQGSAADGLRRAVECIQAGLIGQVSQVHIWTNRPIWPQGMDRPEGEDPIPETLNWDIWLGPAPIRPFKSGVYHPFNWRGWQDFGTGALGDMACHTVNMPFRGLNLGYPSQIEAKLLGPLNHETYPIGSVIRFEFPSRSTPIHGKSSGWFADLFGSEPHLHQRDVTLWWYDGGKPLADNPTSHDDSNKPPRELTTDIEAFLGEVPGSGCLLIGDKGTIFSPDDYGEQFFVKLEGDSHYVHYTKSSAVAAIPVTIPRNPFKGDNDFRHHQEWIAAIKNGRPQDCYSRFDVGARLTEIMLLGCVAMRVGRTIEWDGPAMKAKNAPEADAIIRRQNREGWVLS